MICKVSSNKASYIDDVLQNPKKINKMYEAYWTYPKFRKEENSLQKPTRINWFILNFSYWTKFIWKFLMSLGQKRYCLFQNNVCNVKELVQLTLIEVAWILYMN